MSVNNQKPQLKRISLAEKMKNFKLLKKQRGMTLLEIIIVLGIIGTIAAGVVVLAQRAFDSRAISDVVTNTNTVRVAMKDAYQPRTSTSNTACSSRAAKEKMNGTGRNHSR